MTLTTTNNTTSPVTFTKAGKHTISVVVDPAKIIPDYDTANNKTTITRYVLPV